MSDLMYGRLVDTERDAGPAAATTVAVGNIDGCARYLERDPEVSAILDDIDQAFTAK